MTKISIDPDGKVRHSCVVDSELRDPVIDRCVVDAILGWEFPKPEGGGWVIVTYPFVLTPGVGGHASLTKVAAEHHHRKMLDLYSPPHTGAARHRVNEMLVLAPPTPLACATAVAPFSCWSTLLHSCSLVSP